MDTEPAGCRLIVGRSVARVLIALTALCVVACACTQVTATSSSKRTGVPGHNVPNHNVPNRDSGAVTKAKVLPPIRSSGCSTPPHGELTVAKRTLTVDGAARWYLVSTPPTSGPPTSAGSRPSPLVLDFHGLDEGAELEAVTTQLGPLGQKDGFITAFPQGTGNPVHWDTSAGPARNEDLDFARAMLDQIEVEECVDETRIYATGYSDGAFMTSLVACEMSDRIAAFAPVSGVQLPSRCLAKRHVPILAFHGTADPILYFNGGIGTAVLSHALGNTKGPAPSTKVPPANLEGPGYPAAVAAWARRDGCGADPVDTKVSPHVIRRTYGCPVGVSVEFYIVIGGGHTWPGSVFTEKIAAITGPTTFEINASTTMWSFFERFQV
jgi:polyhydroxybutyrate depolymerase